MSTEQNPEDHPDGSDNVAAASQPGSAGPPDRLSRWQAWLSRVEARLTTMPSLRQIELIRDETVRSYHRDLGWRALNARLDRVQEGWWIGRTPYGYRRMTCRIRDRRTPDRPRTVRRCYLAVDKTRASVVAEVFGRYVDDRRGPAAIATRLTAEPDHYPLPIDPATGAERPWTAATVRTILDHPAYLGYTACGRTRDGRPAPVEQWTWSPAPTHPALVGLADWWTAHYRLHPVKPNDVTVQIADIEEAA